MSMFGKGKPIILPKDASAYDPKIQAQEADMKERKKMAEEVAQYIIKTIIEHPDTRYTLIDVFNACEVIKQKVMHFVDEKSKDDKQMFEERMRDWQKQTFDLMINSDK